MEQQIRVREESPIEPRNRKLIADLDQLMISLYPTESNHLMSPENLATGRNKFFVATIYSDVAGCGAMIVENCEYSEVKRIYVVEAARNQGVAQSILSRLEAETKKLGLPAMKLETGTLQPDAIKLFEKVGFSKCAAFGQYSENDPYSYFMHKSL